MADEVPAVWEQIEEQLAAQADDFAAEDIDALREFFLEHFDEIEFSTEDVRLASFSVRNFKAISRTELVDFPERATYLYGPNSKGKTSLVRAIQFNIAGIPRGDEDAFGMRKLVHDRAERLSTTGFWRFDDAPFTVERNLVQSGPGERRTEFDKPFLREGFIEESDSVIERMEDPEQRIGDEQLSPDALLEYFGLLELKQRGHTPFNVLSLFFLMGEDFKRFFGKNSQLIDLIFGINVSSVVEAIDAKISDLELAEEEANAQGNLTRFQQQKETLGEEIEERRSERERKIDQLTQLQDRLESINDILSGEDKVQELQNRLDELRGRRADLKVQLEETVDELGQIKRLIERHDSTELHQDLSGIADDLRDLMTVPDSCPICTHEVDSEQRSRLVNDGDCPLCGKEMPDDRMRVELDHHVPDSLTDGNVSPEEDIQEYREQRRELEGEREHLQRRIEDIEEEMESVRQRLEDSEARQLTEEKSTVRERIDQLRKEIFEKESEIEQLQDELDRVEYEIKAQRRLIPIAKAKQTEREIFQRFRPIVEQQREKRRQELKRQLENEISQLLDVFEAGTFADAHTPSFEEGDSYHFTLQTPEGELRSRRPEPSTAETNIHAFLFHTALLRQLSSSINSLPLRMFVIDSPFTNEIDGDNEEDITRFLTHLPELLPNYQIIVLSADTEGFDAGTFHDAYDMQRYPESGQADLTQYEG
ncbi:AAA family ATPase [Haloplanus rallus]|nr:AAA family ATPase [Haloplanus rallus]